ncbi:hypothetical protein CIB95_10570 [Lottiidibacillus patelloidae]|uniref:DUF3221 domain-containing protein n=1 Tax=Lottiidibacillus patelloidae TaxID=2670334 RepID=A0A263BSG8_9BACI|nr:hypothetical protein [Lottiidibacillus patelloidae]OZM56660.1 hypothetical protein CIB95_10570 [Lottiidibacillus patelloidae]
MKNITRSLIIFLLLLLAGCSTHSSGDFEVIDETDSATAESKPELNIKIKIVQNEAILFVDTDLLISKVNYGKERKAGEGHIHVYVNNGEKQAITSFRYILKEVKPGKNVVRVSLHNNDHTPYGVYEVQEFYID